METAAVSLVLQLVQSGTVKGVAAALLLLCAGFLFALIRLTAIVARSTGKLEVTGTSIADAIKEQTVAVKAQGDASAHRDEATQAQIVTVEKRVEELGRTVIAAVGTDGELTRGALEDRRLSELTEAAEQARRAAQEAARLSVPDGDPPPRRQRTGSQASIR